MLRIITLVILLQATTVFAATLHAYLGNVNALRADFQQTVQGEGAGKQQPSSGKLSVQSPGKFRLEYLKPFKQLYIADGKRLWSYDEDLEQVTVKAQKELLANSPAMVLSNPKDLDKVYLVQANGTHDGVDWFTLKPKTSDSGFESVRLGFAENKLKVFEMRDSFGQTTQLQFSNMQYNPSLKADLFSFTPPKGVDVIDDTQATP